MNSALKEGLHKIAVALACLWFWHREQGEFMRFYIRANDLDTNNSDLIGKKITIEIKIEDDV